MTKRDPLLVLLFSIFTCGIYALYWWIVTIDELRANVEGEWRTPGILVIFFSVITCGIYAIYASYKLADKVCRAVKREDSTLFIFVLLLCGGSGIAVVQDKLNEIVK